MARFDELAKRYKAHIALPWKTMLSDEERVIMVVYDRFDERKLPIHIREFELGTLQAGHGWISVDARSWIADYLNQMDYRDEKFADPDEMDGRDAEIAGYAFRRLVDLSANNGPEDVVALWGLASWFGFLKVSTFLKRAAPAISGRLVVFFPGEYYQNNYRFLEARDGWGYRAVPISL